MLYAWIYRPSLGVCSNYTFKNLCHFRMLVRSETRCCCSHEFFLCECLQNNKAFMLHAWIDHPSLGSCWNYSFWNPWHFRKLICSKTHCCCSHAFFVCECFQKNKAFLLYAWIYHPSLGVCSNYSLWIPCHFRKLIRSETRCCWSHEFFVREFFENNKAFMLYAWIYHPSIGVCSNYSFWIPWHFKKLVRSETRCCSHEFFIWECFQNKNSIMHNTWIDPPSLGVCWN